jgi:proteasome accessory factor A
VGLGQDGRTPGFQISQRADFFEVEVGLETTLKRPIVNTRDEPHADADRYRRLHVILGDANMSEICTYLKVGSTALVLSMIEDNFLADDLAIAQPVRELHLVSHDPALHHRLQLTDGRTITALELQGEYLDRARKFVDDRMGDDVDDQTRDVLQRWESVLTRLAEDPMQLAGELDWVAKLRLIEGYRERDKLEWDAPRLQLVDLQYSDIRPEKGLYHRLVRRGAFTTLLDPASVQEAANNPPEDTRAYFRGECLRRYGPAVAAASWDSVIFDVGRESLVRVPMLEPQRGTKAFVGDLLDRCPTAQSLIEALNTPS